MKALSKVGLEFDAEEMYRKVLDESGISLSNEEYDMSRKQNCIQNGCYIISEGKNLYREPILGNEYVLAIKKHIFQQENNENIGIDRTFLNLKQNYNDVLDTLSFEKIKSDQQEKIINNKDEAIARRIEEERKRRELIDFEKRYKDYTVLARGLAGDDVKENLEDIKSDLIHSDIYDMTSDDELIRANASFRVGHRFSVVPEKKKEAERLLKSTISLLTKDDNLLSLDGAIGTVESSQVDLGNLYISTGEYEKAEKSLKKYMETVRREKIEKYDSKIIEARNQGKILEELDYWIDIKGKFATGKKAIIRLLSKTGKQKDAEELYKALLDECRVSLSDDEYNLSISTNCIENGQYMRITDKMIYREPILGNEYLLLRRKNMAEKALSKKQENEPEK